MIRIALPDQECRTGGPLGPRGSAARGALVLACLLAWVPAGAATPPRGAGAATPPPSSCAGTLWNDNLQEITPDGDLRLASSRRIRLVDLHVAAFDDGPGAERAAAAARSLLTSFVGSPVSVTPAGGPDRWDRSPAAVVVDPGSHAQDLSELLVSEGFAVVDAGTRDALCRPDLLKAEAIAREHRLGLWAGAWALAATDSDALRARAGHFAVLTGRIVSVGERSWRTYLNFGRDFARDAAVVIPRRAWRRIKATGLDAVSLKGRQVRVRGVVELHRAPSVEIDAAAMLEVLPERTQPP